MNPKTIAASAFSGALFGLGLAMSGMTDANRVLGFLDVFGAFDMSLIFVLGGAVMTTLILFRVVLKRSTPVFADRFQISTQKRVDAKLLGGAAMFGIGWGIAGYCPGPALAGLGVGSVEALWFVPSMLGGILLHRWFSGG